MKIFFTISILVLLAVVSVFGQNAAEKTAVCTNQTIEKISSRGINLGMSLEDALGAFSENGKLTLAHVSFSDKDGNAVTAVEAELKPTIDRLQERAANNFNFSSTALIPKDKSRFDGISRYYLGFLDNRLAFFTVYYLKPKWENLEQFAVKLSEMLDLPVQDQPFNPEVRLVKCGDYTVEFRRNYRDLSDYSMSVSKNVDEIIRERKKKFEDEQREKDIKTFRP
jgi:hypothetical protein